MSLYRRRMDRLKVAAGPVTSAGLRSTPVLIWVDPCLP